ncbi:SDR family NAD(P)-dependent oxidoreductase [Sphingomonas jatrophae]|uniref:NAD(P)-dependent dehydrogenase, short-chain alcohol dehydrogenase family n=1 Tax=Sphingomonas jatrophae TaxID=1166337 RepID=A0A1I6M0H8_9SPHN|nr:SDR family NAD(P)-dependent oxidoreductase [Sphingomonas jatrophae]SFS09002.1 NAD(P)-dependent dehydrogenase, short-chain alcohol dehydrogenase family [Sphingomonas jatrophae]
MNKRFEGKRVLLTGGASGIGRATAKRFAAEGARVVIGDIDEAGASKVAAMLGGHHVFYDASDPAAGKTLVERCSTILGGIDVLLNIAGIMTWGRVEDTSVASWQRTLDIDLSAVFYLTQAAIPILVESRGCIVNVSSAGGHHPVYGTVAYGVAKAGVIALTKSTALEMGRHGVRANVVCPGGVATPMHEKTMSAADFDMAVLAEASARNMPKLAGVEACTPEEIAVAIAYLASDDARYATGTVLTIDGGQTTG